MPKLPVDFVKAPSFDNPLRSTAKNDALVERRIVLRLDELTWDVVQAASEREGITAEVLLQRALDRYLSDPAPAARSARPAEARPSGLRAQLVEHLRERVRRTWVHRLLSFREALREGRA
jgi:hypothetical protein